jgi:hypothetical protein
MEFTMRLVSIRPWPRRLGLVLALAASLSAHAFDLVSVGEAVRDLAAPDLPKTRSMPQPGAPVIELLSPATGTALTSPMDIKLRWTAGAGSSVDVSSARIKYGRLGLDVTDRVLGAAKVTATGIDAPGAKLPPGTHRLAVEVADDQKRVGRREFTVQILD